MKKEKFEEVQCVKEEWRNTAVNLGKKAWGAFKNFREERKRNLAAPSGKPRIRSTNDQGYDDILKLTDTQWWLLSERQFKTIQKRLDDDYNAPAEALLRMTKEMARRYRNAEGMNMIAGWYEKGLRNVVEQDYAEAFKWYSESARLRDPVGLHHVGWFYANGIGVKKDPKLAVEYYQRAALQGSASSCNNLGFMYLDGIGVKASEAMSFRWFLKAANLGSRISQYQVAESYREGRGVTENQREAFKWYLEADKQGHLEAKLMIGWAYYDGLGVAQDLGKCIEVWTEAAEKGNATAMNNLGVLYYQGKGVSKDLEKSKSYLLSAAKGGEDIAKEHLLEYFGIKA